MDVIKPQYKTTNMRNSPTPGGNQSKAKHLSLALFPINQLDVHVLNNKATKCRVA